MIEIDGAVPSPSLALADEPAFRVLMGRVTGDDSIPIRPAYLLTARDARFAPSLDDVEHLPLTYLGGRPLVRRDEAWAWPRGADGRPLAFVLQVDLQHADEDNSFKGWVTESPHERLHREIGIPGGTLLQVFHDTETYGVPGEDDPRAWQVRFVPAPNEDDDRLPTWRLAAYPEDLPTDRRREPVHLHAEFAATIPSPLDRPTEGRSAQEVDGYWQLHSWLERYGYTQNLMRLEHILPPESDEQSVLEPVEAPSRVGGFPSVPFDEDDDRELRRALRLPDGLEPVLVAEVAPLPLGEGDWFHGGRPLQVWMHPDDLRGGVTERAWCQIRTDG